MGELVGTSAYLLNGVGVWVAFLFTLMIFSALAGDNPVSRLAQHVLIGAGLGYAAVLAIRHVFIPRLVTPILAGQATLASAWIPLGLAAVLFFAGLDRSIWQTGFHSRPLPTWRRWLQGAGRIVVAILLGIGLGAGMMGALQGTLIPQYVRAAQIGFGRGASGYGPLVGALTLLLTTATLLHLFVNKERYLRDQPVYVQNVIGGWLWLGQRALWFASGLIFARLIASRLSLLIARVAFLRLAVIESGLWAWLASLR